MVETWQILVAGGGILVTVLSVYGGLIKVVYDAVKELRQRFFGADADGTDDGFVGDTKERLRHLEEGQRSIRDENRMQSRLMTSIAYGLEDLTAALSNTDEVDVDLDHVRVRDDFYRGGGGGEEDEEGDNGPMADGGTPPQHRGQDRDIEPADLPPAPWHGRREWENETPDE